MGSELVEFVLGDKCAVKSSKRIFAKEYVPKGIPFFRSKDVIDKSLGVFEKYDLFISEERFNQIKEKFGAPKKGDLLISSVGNRSGQPYIVQDEGDFYFKDGNILWLSDFNGIDPDFLAYWLKSSIGQAALDSIMIGSAQKALTIDAVRKLRIRLPGYESQLKAADVLKSIDYKIQLNRQINTTLESMAQALFKSWFVDFDPVIDNALAAGNPIPDALQARAHARQEMRTAAGASAQPLPVEIRQLFPNSFVFSEEMGWIPEGWRIKPLDEIAHYQNGLALQKFRPENEEDYLPVVKIAQLKKGYADGEEKASPSIKPECIIDSGDVVFSWSGSLMVDIWCGGKAALNQHLFKVTSLEFPRWFYLHFTLHHLAEFQRIAADKAVTMGHIKREHLSQAKCVVASEDLLEELSRIMEPMVERAILCRLQSRELAQTRDSILPKLLSGQLQVPEAEQQLAEVI